MKKLIKILINNMDRIFHISKYFILLQALIFSLNLFSEIIFSDDFETETGWVLAGEFEIDAPQGLGGEHGNSDPQTAYEGEKVLGVDLTGLGSFPGDYETDLGDRECYSISPPIDCSMFIDIELSFRKWLNVETPQYDHAYLDVSNDNGSSWIELWTNNTEVTDNSWAQETYDLSEIASLQNELRIRFSIGSTDGSWQYCGWNIDNFEISGSQVGFGIIQGSVVDVQANEPISNAQVVSQFGMVFSDENGEFTLIDIPEGNRSITVSALGYFDFVLDDIQVVENETSNVICEMELNPENPPEPNNLSYEIYSVNNVHLEWDEPESSEFYLVAYNIYRNNVIIQSILNEEYEDLDLLAGTYNYFVTAVYTTGSSLPSNIIELTILSSSSDEIQVEYSRSLLTCYPNPFNPETRISFETSNLQEKTSLKIYNNKGQHVREFKIGDLNFNINSVIWNGTDNQNKQVASGIYYVILKSGKSIQSKKILLMK